MGSKGRFDGRRRADQGDLNRQVTRSRDGAINRRSGCVVAAHRVNGDANQTLFLVDCPDLALVVIAAVRADAVRRLGLMALRAQVGGRLREGVVGAPLRGARLRMSAFRIRHRLYLSTSRLFYFS